MTKEKIIYYKNCNDCGKIVTKDRWLEKTKAGKNGNARPLCPQCAENWEHPDFC